MAQRPPQKYQAKQGINHSREANGNSVGHRKTVRFDGVGKKGIGMRPRKKGRVEVGHAHGEFQVPSAGFRVFVHPDKLDHGVLPGLGKVQVMLDKYHWEVGIVACNVIRNNLVSRVSAGHKGLLPSKVTQCNPAKEPKEKFGTDHG